MWVIIMFKHKLLTIALTICIFSTQNVMAKDIHFNAKASISAEASNTAIIFFLQPYIKSAVNTYYSEYMTINPNTALFYTAIVGIEPNKSVRTSYKIIVDVLPYVGAHIVIGKDRIQILLDNEGNIQVANFEHIESYDISEFQNLQSIFIRPLPAPVNPSPK